MSRAFDDGSSQYLKVDTEVAVMPCSMACWFWTDDDTINQGLITLNSVIAQYNGLWMYARGADTGDPVAARGYLGGSSGQAESTSGFSTSTWHHACAIFAAADDHAAYIDGGSKGTDSTWFGGNNSFDNTCAGALYYWGAANPTIASPMSGRIAEAAIWNVALSDAEVAMLGAGFCPLFVKPENLVGYWPLIRDTDDDVVGGHDMTPANSPTIAAHPPDVMHPPPLITLGVPAAAPVAGQPMMLRGTGVPGMRQWQPGIR